MVRWRLCLFLAMLLVLPDRRCSKLEDEDEESSEQNGKRFPSRSEEGEEEDEDDDEDDEEAPPSPRLERPAETMMGRRVAATARASTATDVATRTVPRRPLECYVCAYKAETQLRSCLDPTKYRVHTMVCHSADDKCFTSVMSKGNVYAAVMRGCRSGCMSSSDTTCCELNRCNNQALAVPVAPPHVLTDKKLNKSNKAIPPSVLFFVTILLVLQTVVKVAFV